MICRCGYGPMPTHDNSWHKHLGGNRGGKRIGAGVKPSCVCGHCRLCKRRLRRKIGNKTMVE